MRARFNFVASVFALAFPLFACDGRLRTTQNPASSRPAIEDAGPPVAVPVLVPDAAIGPRVIENWACQRTNGSVVFQHMANIRLRDDATFDLYHTNSSQNGGWMSSVQGTWQREASGALILTPVTATRRRWIGDGHRHDHGEKTLFQQTSEPVSSTPWRLRPEADGTLYISEVHTHVGRTSEGAQAMPCDDVVR